jgi:hypothetical protein
MTINAPSQETKPGGQRGIRRRLQDWGDRLCCAGLLAAGLGGAALLAWSVWHMPALR